MELENKMKYAITLADINFHHEFEDLFKLASLCEDIELLRNSGAQANQDLETEFYEAIKVFYNFNGRFRQEIERFAQAKRLIQGI